MKYLSFIVIILMLFSSCEKANTYEGTVSPYVAISDIRNLYKDKDVKLTNERLNGGNSLAAIVVSDDEANNFPSNMLVVQDQRRSSKLRGITIWLENNNAFSFHAGDSVLIRVENDTLTKVNGLLSIKGVTQEDISIVSRDNAITPQQVKASDLINDPSIYESTLIVLVKCSFNPSPVDGETFSGKKVLNDGFGNIPILTEEKASFADTLLPVYANYTGVFLTNIEGNDTSSYIKLRNYSDISILGAGTTVPTAVISGYVNDPNGTDDNCEYIQFLALENIDFSQTPYAVVFSNNAGASTPAGYPTNGWATGDLRTYKLDLTEGTVSKGDYFYVGGTKKLINGPSSTKISSVNWIRTVDCSTTPGDDFGATHSALMPNSGNAFGIAFFKGISVTEATVPMDVIFVSNGGNLYDGGTLGYRIANTDWYDIVNPLTLVSQPFYLSGTNTTDASYNTSNVGYFVSLGGAFNTTLGRWTVSRSQNNILLTKTSSLEEIENDNSTRIEE